MLEHPLVDGMSNNHMLIVVLAYKPVNTLDLDFTL